MQQATPSSDAPETERDSAAQVALAPVAVSTGAPVVVTLDDAREYTMAISRHRGILWLTTPVAGIASAVAAGLLGSKIPGLQGFPAFFATMAGSAMYFIGMKRQLARSAEARFRPPLPWSELVAMESSAGIRELDEPEARTHRKVTPAERLTRFHAEILRRCRAPFSDTKPQEESNDRRGHA